MLETVLPLQIIFSAIGLIVLFIQARSDAKTQSVDSRYSWLMMGFTVAAAISFASNWDFLGFFVAGITTLAILALGAFLVRLGYMGSGDLEGLPWLTMGIGSLWGIQYLVDFLALVAVGFILYKFLNKSNKIPAYPAFLVGFLIVNAIVFFQLLFSG